MTPNPFAEELNTLRDQLAQLEADVAELQRLHDERAEQLAALPARDFVKRAELEGQRAAFEKMLAEQQREVQQAREGVAALEAAALRDAKLNQIGQCARDIEAARLSIHQQQAALRDTLAPLLLPILEAIQERGRAHQEWRNLAAQLGVNVYRFAGPEAEQRTRELLEELEARGVDTMPLRWDWTGQEISLSQQPAQLPTPPAESLFAEHLGHAVRELVTMAATAQARAQGFEPGTSVTAIGSSVTAGASFPTNAAPVKVSDMVVSGFPDA